jgi:hypothetical protein
MGIEQDGKHVGFTHSDRPLGSALPLYPGETVRIAQDPEIIDPGKKN